MFLFRTNKKVNFYELSLSTASYLLEKSLTFVQANKKKKGVSQITVFALTLLLLYIPPF